MLSPERETDALTTASTPSCRAISRNGSRVEFRYRNTDAREMALTAAIFASSSMIPWCSPSTNVFWVESPMRFSSGNTARRREVVAAALRRCTTKPRPRAVNRMATDSRGTNTPERRGGRSSRPGAWLLDDDGSGDAAVTAVGFSRRVASARARVSADGSSSYSCVSRNANASYARNAAARPPSDEVAIRRLMTRSEEHTSELQSRLHLVCRLLLEKKKKTSLHEEQ